MVLLQNIIVFGKNEKEKTGRNGFSELLTQFGCDVQIGATTTSLSERLGNPHARRPRRNRIITNVLSEFQIIINVSEVNQLHYIIYSMFFFFLFFF